MEYDFNIQHYFNGYKKWKKTIIIVVIIAVFLAMYVSLLKPQTYASKTTLLLIDQGASSGSLGRFLGISNLSIGPSSSDVIIAILQSKRMVKDINDKFKIKDNPKSWWNISTYIVTAGLTIEIKGSDPQLTEKIANFAIQNLDIINAELNITPNKPMVKVLDPANTGTRGSRQILRNMFIAGFFSFMIFSLYIFFLDYFKNLKKQI